MYTEHKLPQLEPYNKVEKKIKEALDLDLNERPGLKRGTGAPIVMPMRQHASKKERLLMVDTKIRWGWQYPMTTYKRSKEVAQAACRLIACDYGFRKTLAFHKFLDEFNLLMVTLEKARVICCHPVTLVLMCNWKILSPDTEDIRTRFSKMYRAYTGIWKDFKILLIC